MAMGTGAMAGVFDASLPVADAIGLIPPQNIDAVMKSLPR